MVFGYLVTASGWSAALQIVCDERPQMEVLKEWLQEQGHQVTIFDQRNFATAPSKPAGIFMYVHGMLDEAAGKRLIRFAKEGGRLIILHHGIASAKLQSPGWMQFVGISILPRNASEYPWAVLSGVSFEMVNLAPGHYVTTHRIDYPAKASYRRSEQPSQGESLPAFTIADTEAYLNQLYTPGQRRILLFGMKCQDPIGGTSYEQDTGAWMMRSGKGWIFYFQPGHHARDFQVPQFRQILLNALTWKP